MQQNMGEGIVSRDVRQRMRLLWCVLAALISAFAVSGTAGEKSPESAADRTVSRIRSGRLELHTDLAPREARALLGRLEATLRRASRYWGRPLNQRVLFFVAEDVSRWSDEWLPHPQAKVVLTHVKGGTEIVAAAGGAREAHVYARSEPGIAEHELVHAYCLLAFGTCGPDWYKEGMAELAFHHTAGDRAVRCRTDVADRLRAEKRTVREIVHTGEFTRPLADRFRELHGLQLVPVDVKGRWHAADDAIVRTARHDYHRSWALCHFLSTSPNYKDRFRKLGLAYLNQTGTEFEQVFAPVAEQLEFEFALFMRDLEDGYRVDLCCWDWDHEFTAAAEGEARTALVLAARGYQPAGLLVAADETYNYMAEGQWSTCCRLSPVTADGSYFGQGALEAVIQDGYKLGEPFDLGRSGSFTATGAGKLYLRCRDDWHRLADNHGEIKVHLTKIRKEDQRQNDYRAE